MSKWQLRAPATEDLNLIKHSWLKSHRDHPQMSLLTTTVYFQRMNEIVDRTLASPSCRCVVACDPGLPGQIFGYGVGEIQPDGTLYLHWIYTKHSFRNFGIARDIENELKKIPHKSVRYSIHTKVINKLIESREYTYDPFVLWSKLNANS